jgi:hypothetical protein
MFRRLSGVRGHGSAILDRRHCGSDDVSQDRRKPLTDPGNAGFGRAFCAPSAYSHFFHLKKKYGSTAAITITTNAIG